MARIRSIKPEFFINDELGELPPLTRLFYVGLWTQADRDGRLEDRPKRLKASLVPYDECDVESMLADLTRNGHLRRYAVDGANYIQIINFAKHQNPHYKELPSDLPAPESNVDSTLIQHQPDVDSTLIQHQPDVNSTSGQRRDVGKEGKGEERRGEEARSLDQPANEKTIAGDKQMPQCLTAQIELLDPPYSGTCIGYINHACERQFGSMLSHAERSELFAAINDGCIYGCEGDHPQDCAMQIAHKLATKGKTRFATSRLWLKTVREDRMEVQQR